MHETADAAMVEEDANFYDNELNIVYINVPMKYSYVNELLENYDNDLINEWGMVTFFIVKEWNFNIFIKIWKKFLKLLYLLSILFHFRISDIEIFF